MERKREFGLSEREDYRREDKENVRWAVKRGLLILRIESVASSFEG